MASRRSTWAFIGLLSLLLAGIIVPFMIWGEKFDAVLTLEGARQWMESFGPWAWLAGIGLLIADIALPIPSTVVMSALGWMYGWLVGGLIAAAGSFGSGIVAYGLCRWLGRTAALKIAGEEGLERGAAFFARRGGIVVTVSRWMPVLPEAIACLAGLVKMRWSVFVLSLACGSLPLGFAFAAIGHLGHASPAWALALSALLPIGLWIVAKRWLR